MLVTCPPICIIISSLYMHTFNIFFFFIVGQIFVISMSAATVLLINSPPPSLARLTYWRKREGLNIYALSQEAKHSHWIVFMIELIQACTYMYIYQFASLKLNCTTCINGLILLHIFYCRRYTYVSIKLQLMYSIVYTVECSVEYGL